MTAKDIAVLIFDLIRQWQKLRREKKNVEVQKINDEIQENFEEDVNEDIK